MHKSHPKRSTSPTLCSAKIQPPGVGNRIFPCERLFTQIKESLTKGHLWIEAPPGAGKTMLAAEFLSQNSIRTAWYELDSLDTDPVAFFSFFPQAFSSLSSIKPCCFLFTRIISRGYAWLA